VKAVEHASPAKANRPQLMEILKSSMVGHVCNAMQRRWQGQISRSLSRQVELRLLGQRSDPVHLDMWRKLRLGWVEPRIFCMSGTGNAAVREGPAGSTVV
jgi:hypothetical protein